MGFPVRNAPKAAPAPAPVQVAPPAPVPLQPPPAPAPVYAQQAARPQAPLTAQRFGGMGSGARVNPGPPPAPSIGGASLASRTPELMSDYVRSYLPANPTAPSEYAFVLEILQVEYKQRLKGDPMVVIRCKVIESECHMDPPGVQRAVIIYGSTDMTKGGLDAFYGRIKAVCYAILGVTANTSPEELQSIDGILDTLFLDHIVGQNAAAGVQVRVLSRANGQFANHIWEAHPDWDFEHLPVRLREAIEAQLAAQA